MSREEFYETHSETKPGMSIIEQGNRIDALPDNTEIWVHHATDPTTAKIFLEEGINTSQKPHNLARMRYEEGEYAEFAPGRGLSPGLTVGATPQGVSGYGRVNLAIKIRKGDLKVSPEQEALGVTSPGQALVAEDAYVEGFIPPENIIVLGEQGRYPRHAYEEFVEHAKQTGKI